MQWFSEDEDEPVSPARDDSSFDPFATISGDDAFTAAVSGDETFVATFPEDSGQGQTSGECRCCLTFRNISY